MYCGGPRLGSSIQGICVFRNLAILGLVEAAGQRPLNHSGDSALYAGVPTALDGIQERFDIWLAVAMIDLAGGADVVTEELRRHDKVGAVAANMAVQSLLDADRVVPSLNVDLAQKRAVCLIRIMLNLAQADGRVAAVAELDHR